MARGAPRSNRRVKLVAGSLARIVALAVLVVATGAIAGIAVGYPLRTLDLGGSKAIALDQEALAGTIDAELALVTKADLPNSFVADDSFVAGVALVGTSYCGQTTEPEGQVGDHLAHIFSDKQNNSYVMTEVVRVRRTQDAGKYIRDVTRDLDGCKGRKFYKVEGQVRTKVEIRDDRGDPPVVDYVSRTLRPVDGGTVQVVTYFQVGNIIVALQYIGPANPPKTLLSKAEKEILYRVAPKQLTRQAKVAGAKPLPDESATTTTIADAVEPSPTSSPPVVPTEAPDPTFETPATTRAPR